MCRRLAIVVCIALVHFPDASGKCSRPRIRKSWDRLTETEQKVYLDAVALSMQKGYHSEFITVHSQLQNSMVAHDTCGFSTWHRKYLLAYENMLRSLGKQFECVTIPFWDYFEEYERFANQECSSMLNCSSLLKSLGGSSGDFMFLNIQGEWTQGFCTAQWPMNNFCQHTIDATKHTDNTCSKCISRGNWNVFYPGGITFSSALSAIVSSRDFQDLTFRLQGGIHNAMHNALGGAMHTLVSPADPIFYSHHATIDLLFQASFQCRIGRTLSRKETPLEPMAFAQCSSDQIQQGPSAMSKITMYLGEKSLEISRFFDELNDQHLEFTDTTDLGSHSYSYELPRKLHDQFQALDTCVKRKTSHGIERSAAKQRFLRDGWRFKYKEFLDYITSKTTRQGEAERLEQIEATECLAHNYMFGRDTYADGFVENFHVKTQPHCNCVEKQVTEGSFKLLISDWKTKLMEIFS